MTTPVLDPVLFNRSPDCVKLIKPDGRLVFMNVAGCKALEVNSESVPGQEWLSLLPSSVRPDGSKALQEAVNGKSPRFLGKSEHPLTGVNHWDNMLTPIPSSSGAVTEILCISRNVTEQHINDTLLKQKLAELNERSRDFVATAKAIRQNSAQLGQADLLKMVEELLDPIEEARSVFRKVKDYKDSHSTSNFDLEKSDSKKLTDSERECLFWIGIGKTAWETAAITGRSQRTVEFHLNNLVKKLNATNRVHAAVIASRRELL